MSNEFKREDRYIVFKVSDLGNSLKGDEIRKLAEEYAEQRQLKGKEPLKCVVVESDWPEYEPTWKAIEARMTGSPEESAVQTAARIMNSELIQERDALLRDNTDLRARIEAMERQEPVAWARKIGLDVPSFGCVTDLKYRPSDIPESSYIPLYTNPCAQPAPSIRPAALYPVISWLRNGCDPMKAAEELELIAAAPEVKP